MTLWQYLKAWWHRETVSAAVYDQDPEPPADYGPILIIAVRTKPITGWERVGVLNEIHSAVLDALEPLRDRIADYGVDACAQLHGMVEFVELPCKD